MKCIKITYKNYSLIVEGTAKVYYKVGEFAEAPEWLEIKRYYLTAFRSLDDALAYMDKIVKKRFKKGQYKYIKIWEAEGEDLIEELPRMAYFCDLTFGRMIYAPTPWPKGTVMFKKLKLIKEINYDNKRTDEKIAGTI